MFWQQKQWAIPDADLLPVLSHAVPPFYCHLLHLVNMRLPTSAQKFLLPDKDTCSLVYSGSFSQSLQEYLLLLQALWDISAEIVSCLCFQPCHKAFQKTAAELTAFVTTTLLLLPGQSHREKHSTSFSQAYNSKVNLSDKQEKFARAQSCCTKASAATVHHWEKNPCKRHGRHYCCQIRFAGKYPLKIIQLRNISQTLGLSESNSDLAKLKKKKNPSLPKYF